MDPDFEKGLNRLDPPPPARAASPFAGTWTITGDVAGNPVNTVCTLTVDAGGSVGGTCKVPTGDTKATGEVKDATLTFQVDVTHQGTDYVLVFTGTARVADGHEGHHRRGWQRRRIHGNQAIAGGPPDVTTTPSERRRACTWPTRSGTSAACTPPRRAVTR